MNKVERIKKLADAMYNRMQNLTTDTSGIRKAMDEYHQFIINEYYKEDTEKDFGIKSSDLEEAAHSYVDTTIEWFDSEGNPCCYPAFIAGAQWQKKQIVLNDNNKEYHRVPSTTLKRLYMNETKYELLKSDIIEGIVGDFEKGTIHNYLTIKIPMLLCPSNCAKGNKVKLIIVKEE